MLERAHHIHFIGIGGIGMSGIATFLRKKGYQVSGCDIDIQQPTIFSLQQLGCIISQGHNSHPCLDPSIDQIVYIKTYTHIPAYKQELERAHNAGIGMITRSEMLAYIMQKYVTFCVTGSHGKTTTSSLLSHVLIELQQEPTCMVGGYLKNINSNFYMGRGNLFVAEADESDRSFLELPTNVGIITNISLEHLETYKDLDDIIATYLTFINNIQDVVILCLDNSYLKSLSAQLAHKKIITYGTHPQADIQAHTIQLHANRSEYLLNIAQRKITNIPVSVPLVGVHNILNSLAVISATHFLELPLESVLYALTTFRGVERRFCLRGYFQGAAVIDDYAHHPNEIQQMLQVARTYTTGKVITIFQPHRYSRTAALWHQFIEVFAHSNIDYLFITDIYGAGEAVIEGLSSNKLIDEIRRKTSSLPATYIPFDNDFSAFKGLLNSVVSPDDIILILGAGSIYQLSFALI